MKRCPACNRTFSDETLSFCIADGQLLSASYDSPATLPLAPARATDGAVTEIIPSALTPERARQIIRRNRIAGLAGVPIGAIIMLIMLSSDPQSQNQPIAGLIAGGAFGALIYGYMFWSSFFGFPKVWSWWRTPVRKLYQLANRIEFNSAVTVVLILAGVCALAPAIALVLIYFYSLFWVGLFYSFFGGGIYQFLQTRKIAKAQ
ncbi:MAG TPA: hypothetical protein VFZ40_12360 [Pyrinomonadaceae bacterium]